MICNNMENSPLPFYSLQSYLLFSMCCLLMVPLNFYGREIFLARPTFHKTGIISVERNISTFPPTLLLQSQNSKQIISETLSAKGSNETSDSIIMPRTRFVTFLFDSSYFSGAMALIGSLSRTLHAKILPPLVMIAGNATINASQVSILEILGAQVKLLDLPIELMEAMKHLTIMKPRWEGVFSKFLLFKPEIVECEVIFYVDTDAIVRGNVMKCIHDLLHQFNFNPQLRIMAVGNRTYFNNGVMLARPSTDTYNYMVSMVRNGTCDTNCTEHEAMTKMKRRIRTDQDVFVEYTERFPETYQPIRNLSSFNYRPMHNPYDMFPSCSIVHYAGRPKPWEIWLSDSDGQGFPLKLLKTDSPRISQVELSMISNKTIPEWALSAWTHYWNKCMKLLESNNT